MFKSLMGHIKSWIIINIVLFASYMIYDQVRYSVTGVVDPIAVQVGYTGGMFLVLVLYAVVIQFVIRMLKKLFSKRIA